MVNVPASGTTSGTLTATTDLTPDVFLEGEIVATATDPVTIETSPLLAGNMTAEAVDSIVTLFEWILTGEMAAEAIDSIAALSEEKTELPIADIIESIRILLDEVAHAISSHALTIATVYSSTVMASYLIDRITRDMPTGRLLRRLLDHLASV